MNRFSAPNIALIAPGELVAIVRRAIQNPKYLTQGPQLLSFSERGKLAELSNFRRFLSPQAVLGRLLWAVHALVSIYVSRLFR